MTSDIAHFRECQVLQEQSAHHGSVSLCATSDCPSSYLAPASFIVAAIKLIGQGKRQRKRLTQAKR